ncbi:NUDIX domain-containing protein [Novosphingobium sp. ZN18A2]|uniref:NUDIX hydrolase n=1 Tax=Novosphingobium sp. ZN18A2 TaxID=3079861 RepID=UPI0030D5975A
MPIAVSPLLHRTALRIAQAVRLRWWRFAGGATHGCAVIAQNRAGEILLVRHTYHRSDQWMLPGGGIGALELPLAAAIREVLDETGCRLAGTRHVATHVLDRGRWVNTVELVFGTTADLPRADGREIAEARFFNLSGLPESLGELSRAQIAAWRESDRNAR